MSNLTVSRAKELAALINENETQIKSLGMSMLDRAISSGRHLIEIKEILPHGEFRPFCKDNVRVQNNQVARYMKAASEEGRLPEYSAVEGNIDKGLWGFINFLSPSNQDDAGGYMEANETPYVSSRTHLHTESDEDYPDREARHDDLENAEPAKPYKPKVYDMPVNERLQSCALGVIQAGLQFFLANQETGGRLTHDQVVRAIQAELVTTSTPHPNKAKVYREAHEQTEQFLAVFAEAFAEISPAISLNKVSSI